jgi:multiple sugar transport system substrate-binding protein
MRKFLFFGIVLLFAGFGLTAAGQAEPAQQDEPVVIRIQGYGGQDPAIVVRLLNEVIGADLEKDNIKLVYEPIEGDYNAGLYNSLSAGTAGDILYVPVETAPGIIATGQIQPLNGLIDTTPFIDSLIEAYTINGDIFGIPKDFNTLVLYYNMDLFDEAGVEYPTDNETWSSLARKAEAISALGSDMYGIAFQPSYDRFGAFTFGAGWTPFDSQGKTNLMDPAFVSTFTWYTDLIKSGAAVMPSDLGQGWTGGAFATEQVGMALEGAWMIGFLNNDAPNIPFESALLPAADDGTKGNFLYTVAYGINRQTENLEAAVKVLAALTSEKAQQFILEEGLAIPSRKSLADNPYFKNDSREARANKAVFVGSSTGNVLGYQFGNVGTDWMTPINTAIVTVAAGEVGVQEALQAAQREIDEMMK